MSQIDAINRQDSKYGLRMAQSAHQMTDYERQRLDQQQRARAVRDLV